MPGGIARMGQSESGRFCLGKESLHIVSTSEAHGKDLKKLGVTYDVNLTM